MHRLISYFLSNTSAKIYRNRIVYVKTIASQTWDVFETQCSSWPIRARIASYLVFLSQVHFHFLPQKELFLSSPRTFTCDLDLRI